MENDTIKLLKQVNSGCKMSTNTIEQVLPDLKDEGFINLLHKYNKLHVEIGDKSHEQLNQLQADEKDPSPMADAFAKMMTEMKLLMDKSPQNIGKIMAKGCGMGIESISKYINEYTEADEQSVSLAKKLVSMEEDFLHELEGFL